MKAMPFFFFLLLVLSCGSEATDRPQDCREDQFFNEARRVCQTCPAVSEPACRPGCGFEIISDPRGCPVMTCESLCQGCDADEIWDPVAELCAPQEEEDEEES